MRPHMLAALAPVGAKLPLKESESGSAENKESFGEVRKAKIRGVESAGMLCSVAELGLEKNSRKYRRYERSGRSGRYRNCKKK